MEITKVNPDFELDLSYLEEIAGGNTDFIVEMIDLFLQQAPESIADIYQRICEKDWLAAGNLAHKLKPTFSMIGVLSGRDLIERIEKSARAGKDVEQLPALVDELKNISKIAMGKLMKRKADLMQA